MNRRNFLKTSTGLAATYTITNAVNYPSVSGLNGGKDKKLVVYVSCHSDDWDIQYGGQIIEFDAWKHPILLIIVTDSGADVLTHDYFNFNDLHTQPSREGERPYSHNVMLNRTNSVYDRANQLGIEHVICLHYPDSMAQHHIQDIAQDIENSIVKTVQNNSYTFYFLNWHPAAGLCDNANEHSDHQATGDSTLKAVKNVLSRLGMNEVNSQYSTVYSEPVNPAGGDVYWEDVTSVWKERMTVWNMMFEHKVLENIAETQNRPDLLPQNPEHYVGVKITR